MTDWTRRPDLLLALAGAVSGIVNWLVFETEGFFAQHVLGLVFGLTAAVALGRAINLSVARAALVVGAFSVSWVAAFRLALETATAIDNEPFVGAVSGAVGGAIVAAGVVIAINASARRALILRCTIVGAAFGTLLASGHPLMLFVPWQVAVGFSLGV